MDEAKVRELIMKRQSNKRISCKAACDVADEAGVSRMVVGRLLNEMEIKIHSCQLGCFP